MPSLIEQVIAYLKKASPQEKVSFLDQLTREKVLFDALKTTGVEVEVSDPQTRAIERPAGVISKQDTPITVEESVEIIINNLLNPHPVSISAINCLLDVSDRAAREIGVADIRSYTVGLADAYSNTIRTMKDNNGLYMTLPVYPFMFNGTTWDRMKGTIAGGLLVDLSDKWARQVGKVDIDRILGATASANNPLPTRLCDGTAWLDGGLAAIAVRQATRTSMRTQPEREDLTSLGGVASPNNAGVQIVAGTTGKKTKVFDAEYEGLVDGLHYFYFGTSTTATTRRFLTRNTKGVNSKTFVQPRVSNADDGLYLFSAVSETNMPYDVGYVQE